MSQESSGDQARALLEAIYSMLKGAAANPHFTELRKALWTGVAAAITAFQQSSPDEMTPKLFGNLGRALIEPGRYGEAVEALRTAIGLDPNYAAAHANLGYALNRLGRYGEAVEALQTAIKLNPNSAVTLYNWGYTLNELGRYGEAVKALGTAIELGPEAPYPHELLAEISLRKDPNNTNAALSHLRKAFDLATQENTGKVFWFDLYQNLLAASSFSDEAQETLHQWSRTQDMTPV